VDSEGRAASFTNFFLEQTNDAKMVDALGSLSKVFQ
jgi:hypothetical protein